MLDKSKIQIGLIADGPSIVQEDIYKSLSGKFEVTRMVMTDPKIPTCDLYVVASDKADQALIRLVRTKIAKSYDLVFVSTKQERLDIDSENKAFMYPYKYEIITNLPLILHTLHNANRLKD